MNFLDSISQALFSGLGGGGSSGGGGSDFLSPVASMLDPAGKVGAGSGSMLGGGALSQAGGPMSLLGLLGGGLSGGALGGSPLINAFRDAFMGGGKDQVEGGTGSDPMTGGAPAAPAAPGGMIQGLSAVANNQDLMDAANTALPAAPAAPGGVTLDTDESAYPKTSADQQKFMGMTGNDWRDIVKAVFTGASGVNPNSPGLSAFAQGGAGTFAALDKQKAAQAASDTAAEDRLWKREDRDIAADDRRYNRGRETAKDARDARAGEVNLVKTLSEVMRNMDPQLDTKDRIAVERLVRDEGKRLQDNEFLKGEELKTAMETYRKGLEDRLKSQKPSVGGSAAPVAGGNGQSQQAPARPASREAFDALPSGSWFVNPADGRVMQKK